MLITTAVALMLADLVTTLLGIRIAGPDGEDNPLWRGLIRRHGIAAFVVVHAAVMTAILFAASLAGDAALAGVVAVFALVVINNLVALWRLTAPQTAAGAKAAAEAEIRGLGARWVEAFRTGDVEAFAATYTDDAFLALAGQPALRGKAQVVEFFAPRIRRYAAERVEVSMQFERITVVGDLAYTITLNWITAHPAAGPPFRANARSIVIYRRRPGVGWRMEADIEQRTPDAELPEVPASEL